jgi:hypothetical protein
MKFLSRTLDTCQTASWSWQEPIQYCLDHPWLQSLSVLPQLQPVLYKHKQQEPIIFISDCL